MKRSALWESTISNVPLGQREGRPQKSRAFSVVEDKPLPEKATKQRRGSVACLEFVKKSSIPSYNELPRSLVENVAPNKLKLPQTPLQRRGSDNFYEDEIFEYLCQREKRYMVDSKILTRNDPKCQETRSLLIDWLLLVSHKLVLCQETLYLMVSLIDRSLAKKPELYNKIQLMGVSSLLIASKMEEYLPASLPRLIKLSKNRFEEDDILEMEKELLSLHSFDVQGVEPMTFMNRIILVSPYSEDSDFKETAIFLFDVLLSSKFYSNIRSSLVSAGAVCGALSLYEESWGSVYVSTSKYFPSQVAPISHKMLIKIYQMKTEESDPGQEGIRTKYSSKSRHRSIYHSSKFEEKNILKAIHRMSKVMKESQ